MTISTYSDLQTVVLRQMVRDQDADAQARIPDWITLFEASARRWLRPEMGELRAQNVTLDSQFEYLPDGFIAVRSLKIRGDVDVPLDYMPPDALDRRYPSSATGEPRAYSIIGDSFKVAPAPNGTYTAEMIYHSLPSLGTGQASNWLLNSHPDAYVYGTLVEAAEYYEDARMDRWVQRRDAIFSEINRSSSPFRNRSQPVMMPATTVI